MKYTKASLMTRSLYLSVFFLALSFIQYQSTCFATSFGIANLEAIEVDRDTDDHGAASRALYSRIVSNQQEPLATDDNLTDGLPIYLDTFYTAQRNNEPLVFGFGHLIHNPLTLTSSGISYSIQGVFQSFTAISLAQDIKCYFFTEGQDPAADLKPVLFTGTADSTNLEYKIELKTVATHLILCEYFSKLIGGSLELTVTPTFPDELDLDVYDVTPRTVIAQLPTVEKEKHSKISTYISMKLDKDDTSIATPSNTIQFDNVKTPAGYGITLQYYNTYMKLDPYNSNLKKIGCTLTAKRKIKKSKNRSSYVTATVYVDVDLIFDQPSTPDFPYVMNPLVFISPGSVRQLTSKFTFTSSSSLEINFTDALILRKTSTIDPLAHKKVPFGFIAQYVNTSSFPVYDSAFKCTSNICTSVYGNPPNNRLIIYIVVPVVLVALAIILFTSVCFCKRRRRNNASVVVVSNHHDGHQVGHQVGVAQPAEIPLEVYGAGAGAGAGAYNPNLPPYQKQVMNEEAAAFNAQQSPQANEVPYNPYQPQNGDGSFQVGPTYTPAPANGDGNGNGLAPPPSYY